MVTIYRRGKVWQLSISRNGLQERRSLKTRDRSVAEQLKRQAEIELLAPRTIPKGWVDFEKEFLLWIAPQVSTKTLKNYRFVVGLLTKYLGDIPVSDVDSGTITKFMETRRQSLHPSRQRHPTEGGIKHDLRVLHRVFAHAVDAGYTVKNPVIAQNLNAARGKTQPFSPDEVKTMLESDYIKGKPYLKAIVVLFLHTGLRIGDVIELRPENISGDTIHVKTRKRGTVVRMTLHEEVLAALDDYYRSRNKKQKNSQYVFSTDVGKRIVSLDKHLRRLWKACGIVGGHAHRFRDTFAVALLEQGASLYDVAKLLGISGQTVEYHYSPYTKELQERAAGLIRKLSF
jgi:integrase/recombinase XerD